MKTVVWVGGPEDGGTFRVPDEGAAVEYPLGIVGESLFRRREEGPNPDASKIRVAMVPIVWQVMPVGDRGATMERWAALWNERKESIR